MENQESRMDGTGISEKVIREIRMAAEKYQIEKVIEYRQIL